jgi:aminoglycoside phosphotransferase (APT) family kinase protein
MEIRSGRCRPFLKEIPRSGAHSTVTEVTIGVKGPDERRERLIIRQLSDEKRWQRAERGYQIMAAIAGQGFISGRYRVPQPITDDPVGHVIIEEGVRGKSLHDRLLTATLADGREYLDLAARWLARLHRLRLRITSPEEFIPREIMRLERYVGRFTEMRHRHTRKAQEIMERIALEERALLTKGDELLVQGHGDYHPKNILIGQDQLELRSTLFAAAIDFESSLLAPPAFDVGCFCMQFRNQFHGQPQILAAYSEATFIATYMAEYGAVAPDFLRQVELFAARSALGIAAYLIKLGLGTSEDVWRLLVEAERALTHV